MQELKSSDGAADPVPTTYRCALLMDDDPYSLALTRTTLQGLGLGNIVCAEDGLAGLRALDRMQAAPDLVVCDLFMPGKDGIEFINELGQRHYGGAIILITAGDLDILEMAARVAVSGNGLRLLGAFSKPVAPASLARALGLDGGAARSHQPPGAAPGSHPIP